jgi:hypothetical protein
MEWFHNKLKVECKFHFRRNDDISRNIEVLDLYVSKSKIISTFAIIPF